jgi:hypothetical protein
MRGLEILMSRRRRRGESNRFQLCSDFDPLGNITVVRRVSFDEGELLVAEGSAKRVMDDENVGVIGFQLCSGGKSDIAHEPVDSNPSNAALSQVEVYAVAGSGFKGGVNRYGVYGPPGKSQTAGLNEAQRQSRIKRGLSGEDLVERSLTKLSAWRQISSLLHDEGLAESACL